MTYSNRYILNCLIILSLFTAGLSYGCKFISSGSMTLEICGDYGVKTIQISQNDIPGEPQDEHENARESCAFCFVQTVLADMSVGIFDVAYHEYGYLKDYHLLSDYFEPGLYERTPNALRGPPILFV